MAELSRPPHLADFGNPPLNEVVMGVQFAPPRGYTQLHAGAVWALYKPDFPLAEVWQPLPPTFETYGQQVQSTALEFQLVAGAQHNRFWFLQANRSELIQFQNDRLLHNWRKVGDGTNVYPRFENMIAKLETELLRLESYFDQLSPQSLNCNQAEISYVNNIPGSEQGKPSEIGKWLRFLDFKSDEPEDFMVAYRRTIEGDGAPLGRLLCHVNTAINALGERQYVLNFTLRGAPAKPTIPAALDFLKMGRELIIKEFTDCTTDSAHSVWERKS